MMVSKTLEGTVRSIEVPNWPTVGQFLVTLSLISVNDFFWKKSKTF